MGKIFILEGPECSGKSHLIGSLKNELEDTDFFDEMAKNFSKKYPDLYEEKEKMEIVYITHYIRTMERIARKIEDKNIIMDRGWPSGPVFIKLRQKYREEYDFPLDIFYRFEETMRRFFPRVFKNTVLVFMDLDIETIKKRWKDEESEHRPDSFDPEWIKKSKQCYRERMKEIEEMGGEVERIDANRSKKEVRKQFLEIYDRYSN